MKILVFALAILVGACNSNGSVNNPSAASTAGSAGTGSSGAGTSGGGMGANNGNASSGAGPAGGNGSSGGSSGSTGSMIIGGPCPANIPDLGTGITENPQPCVMTELGGQCPLGFTCVMGQCLLNGGDGPLQVTLSWDDPEDLDLHVVEPQAGGPEDGGCEIWWGNVGPSPTWDGGIFNCLPVGWLDRDSDSACALDGINIENVIYPSNRAAPPGDYTVRVDYWANCDGVSGMSYPSSAYAVQVRANGSTVTACGSLDASLADMGGYENGTVITTFNVP